MAVIGEIRKGRELGHKGEGIRRSKFVYAACEKCGQPRWVRLIRGKPYFTLCKSCGTQERDYILGDVDLRTIRAIGDKNLGYVGNSYINLCFAILIQAKQGRARLWRRFKRAQHWRRGICHRPLDVAIWVCEQLKEEE